MLEGKRYFLTLARYHRWAHGVLMRCVDLVGDEDYDRDLGLFFGSIHRTLNHILLVDRLWYGRFIGDPPAFRGLDETLIDEREPLADALDEQAQIIAHYVEEFPEARFEGNLRYTDSGGMDRELPFAPLLAHVFNHGTHHRGQISAAITRLGHPAPEMDLPYYLIETSQ